jgi:hypothetical protein
MSRPVEAESGDPEDRSAMRTRGHGLVVPILVQLAFAALLPIQASAQSEYGKGEPTGYLAVSGLVAFDDRGDLWAWNWDSADADGGVTARAGVRLADSVAFELQGDWVNLDVWDDNDNWTLTANFRIYPTTLEEVEGVLPFPERLQPYLVAGAGVIGGDPKNDPYQLNGAFRLGAGTDFYLTEQMAVSFGYEWITGTGYWSEVDTRNLVLGLQYNF